MAQVNKKHELSKQGKIIIASSRRWTREIVNLKKDFEVQKSITSGPIKIRNMKEKKWTPVKIKMLEDKGLLILANANEKVLRPVLCAGVVVPGALACHMGVPVCVSCFYLQCSFVLMRLGKTAKRLSPSVHSSERPGWSAGLPAGSCTSTGCCSLRKWWKISLFLSPCKS